ATRPTADWIAAMEPRRIWHAPVQDYADVVADAQVRHLGSLVSVPGAGPSGASVTLVNHPLRYDGQPAAVRRAPQPLGAQTAEVRAELGVTAEEIAELARDGVVRLLHDPAAGRGA